MRQEERGRKPAAGVGDGDRDGPVPSRNVHRHPAAVRSVAEGVVDQVAEGLSYPDRIDTRHKAVLSRDSRSTPSDEAEPAKLSIVLRASAPTSVCSGRIGSRPPSTLARSRRSSASLARRSVSSDALRSAS